MIPRPTFRIVTDLFLLYVHDHSTKLHGPLSFILSCVHDHSTKNQGLIYLFIYLLFVYDNLTSLTSSLTYLFYLSTAILPKTRVFIDLFFYLYKTIRQNYMFVFLWLIFPFCTTIRPKIRSSLINLFFLFVHDHSTKVRCHSYFLIYSFLNCANISFAILTADTAFIFRTPYLWKSCCFISYAISMAI